MFTKNVKYYFVMVATILSFFLPSNAYAKE